MKDVSFIFWPVIGVKCSMFGRLLTSSGLDGTITKDILESRVRELHVCSNICLTIFVLQAIVVSLEDISLICIDTTVPSDSLKREDYWRSTLKTVTLFGLNIEKSF